MLSQKHRLSKSADVKKTTARGRSFFNPYFIIKFTPDVKEVKITFITSVRVSKKAVERNRAKRLLRDELRKHVAKMKPGNYVIILRASATKAEGADLRTALVKSLTSAKMLQS